MPKTIMASPWNGDEYDKGVWDNDLDNKRTKYIRADLVEQEPVKETPKSLQVPKTYKENGENFTCAIICNNDEKTIERVQI